LDPYAPPLSGIDLISYNGDSRLVLFSWFLDLVQESDVMEETNYTDTGVPNTYMDGEFYQALLNEFLESAGTDTKGKKIHKVRKSSSLLFFHFVSCF
jgi:hypothetical protein